MIAPRPDPSRRTRIRGFTLVEVVVSMAILGIVFGVVGAFQMRSQAHSKAVLSRDYVDTRARRALERVSSELRGVGLTFLAPDPTGELGASTLMFQKPADVSDTGVVVWGAPSRLALELESGEDEDGDDDDGDGLVDERRLVLVRDIGTADERTIVLCTSIPEFARGEIGNGLDDDGDGVSDEPGFSIRRVGDLLTVRLTVVAASAGSDPVTTEIQTSVVLRN
jgi:prepilin-type N-terminal cleavage/methylation domain-containing protein